MAITASDARRNLFSLIEQVNNDRTSIEITSRHGNAVLISRADHDALEETAHLLRSPANAVGFWRAWTRSAAVSARIVDVGIGSG